METAVYKGNDFWEGFIENIMTVIMRYGQH